MVKKCCMGEEGCKGIPKYRCEECGEVYCRECAENSDFECDCVEPPRLILISAIKKP